MNHFRALVVEDDAGVSGTLCNALTRLGCRAAVVPDTQQARAELEHSRYDAVFVELCARGEGGGRGIARWLRAHSSGTACFLVTGWKGDLEQSVLSREGVHGIIRKPLIFNEIRDAVIEHFG